MRPSARSRVELRKGKYAIDYLNVPYCTIVSVLRSRFAGNARQAFPGIVTTPSSSEYCQPQRLNCITYYCLLFGSLASHATILLPPLRVYNSLPLFPSPSLHTSLSPRNHPRTTPTHFPALCFLRSTFSLSLSLFIFCNRISRIFLPTVFLFSLSY